MSRFSSLCFIATITALLTPHLLPAEDWPTWRFDGRRSASTPEQLSSTLHLQWSTQQSAPRIAWGEDARLHFDASLEPIVVGKTLFVASGRNDSLTAISTETGQRLWRFFADAPIRFAPIAIEGRVYFGADDGFFYCVQAEDGSLVWRFRAAPSDRRVIGNERFTSAWPIRGGPVLVDETIYFTSGVWPFEGTQLFAIKINEESPQPTAAMLPDQVTPQGYLATENGRVFIPSGRDKATGFEIASGKFVSLNYQSRGKTDYHVTAESDYLLHGDRIYDVGARKLMPNGVHRPISTRRSIVGTWQGNLVAYDHANPELVEKKDRKGKITHEKVLKTVWSLTKKSLTADTKQPADAQLSVELCAGGTFYGIHGNKVFAVNIGDDSKPAVAWTADISGSPSRLIAADGKLFVATREGHIHCFGAEAADTPNVQAKEELMPAATDQADRVAGWLSKNADLGGYCLVVGADSGGIIDELIRQSEMQVVVLDPSESRIRSLRQRYDALGLYGTRLSAFVADPTTAHLPPYVMSLAICESTTTWTKNLAFVDHIHRCLRPYGGRAILGGEGDADGELRSRIKKSKIAQAEVQVEAAFVVLTKAGELPGAADWTHEYGDSSNSLMSQDRLVKAPLGVLWFGGPAAASELFFNRHFWPPSLTVNQGRMFFQGPNVFVAADIYTGRVLWKKALPKGVSPGRQGTYFEKVRVGYHFLAADDAVYLSDGKQCEKIDPANGKTLLTFRLKRPDAQWGTMRIWEDRLICTVFLPDEKGVYQPEEIVSIDRHTGAQVWRHEAEYTAPIAALGHETVFFYDGILEGLHDAWKRKGLSPKTGASGYLKALNIRTGETIWQSGTSRAVTWLGVSSQDGVLVASNKKGMEAWDGKSGQPLWEKEQAGKGFAGHPESVWDKVILWNDRIIDQRGPGLAYDVKTGKQLMKDHPLTGESTPWEFTKSGHHCNYAVASPHLLTFRAGTAGFLDLESGTTGRLNGFRSGCRNSLIPAGGVLNAPNFAHGCVCSYSLFTSLALVHTADADVWTYNAFKTPDGPIQRVGINLGAPGDRQDDNGTLWLDYPSVGGRSPKVNISVAGDNVQYSRGHSLTVEGDLPWVAASGCEGLTSIKVRVGQEKANQPCQVKLYFFESAKGAEGDRVFDVALQGKRVLTNFDIRKAAGSQHRGVVRAFETTAIKDTIEVTFTARAGRPSLAGIEIVMVKE